MRDFEKGLTITALREALRYDPITGHFTRAKAVTGGMYGRVQIQIGERAGCLSKSDGYRYVQVNKVIYSEHRLAWFYVKGVWPTDEIDHADGVRDNNAWHNLRSATIAQNRRNTEGQKSRVGPYPGVYSPKSRPGCYIAQIKHKGVVKYLGSFRTAEAARDARVAAERLLFGEFAGSSRL